MIQYSTIISVVYFAVNIIFLIVLAIAVYQQGGHKVKSKAYLKDIWSQRKIYAPIIIHFYDTATDIGVVYSWYQLMKNEQNDPNIDYESVDMVVFFWTGITFLMLYRLFMLVGTIHAVCVDDDPWYSILFVLFDVYVFAIVYESFVEAQDVIRANAEKRKKKAAKKKEKEETKKQTERAIEMTENKTPTNYNEQTEQEQEQEIEPTESQSTMLVLEAVLESMPQIVLQSVFVIRSANDEELEAAGSSIYLLLFSVVASLFSIASKYMFWDKDFVEDKAKALKPRERFPGCVQWWYLVRVLWRMMNIMSRFVVFALIWTVMGGAWLPIWAALVWICWVIRLRLTEEGTEEGLLVTSFAALGFMIGVYGDKEKIPLFVLKFIETIIGLILVTIFATLRFDCNICVDPESRQIFDNPNERLMLFWILGISSSILDILLYLVMYFNGVWE